jgi:predicted hydrocarbon binding protein
MKRGGRNAMFPKAVPTFVHVPKRRFFHIVLTQQNRKGAIANLTTLLAENGVNLFSGILSSSPDTKSGTISFFVECKDKGMTSAKLKRIVQKSPFTIDAKVDASIDGLLFDRLTYPLVSSGGNSRLILFEDKWFSRMIERIREVFGTGGEVIAYEFGKELGRDTVREFKGVWHGKLLDGHFGQFLNIYSAFGWGIAKAKHGSPSKLPMVVQLEDSFECGGREATRPASNLVRGHLAGAMSEITGNDAFCEETKCIAKGDALCEFTVTSG